MKYFIGFTSLTLSLALFGNGTEIGNGRKLIENIKGGYKIAVPEKTEVGTTKNFTEVTSPLSEGTPRARLQINVVKDDRLKTYNDLVDSRKDGDWKPIKLADLDGIQKEDTLSTRLRQIEIRLFLRAGEVVVINLEGVPGPSLTSPFEAIKDSLETLKVQNR